MISFLKYAAGFRASNESSSTPYDPATKFPYVWEYTDAKTGWNTELGGDGTTTMFIDSPQLAIAEGGSYPGLLSDDTTGHASNPPEGWKIDDVLKAIVLTDNGGEITLKPSRWGGSADGDLAPNLEDFLWGFHLISNGGSNNDTVKGNGANWPTSKFENFQGQRIKIGDNFNDQLDGLGNDTDECPFQLTPTPSSGDEIFFAYMRDVSEQDYYFWWGTVVAGATRADLIKQEGIADNAVYLKTTSPRNDDQERRDIRFNEGTGLKGMIFDNAPTDYATADAAIGDHFEYLVSKL